MNIEYLYRNKTMQLQLVKDYSSLISFVGCTEFKYPQFV